MRTSRSVASASLLAALLLAAPQAGRGSPLLNYSGFDSGNPSCCTSIADIAFLVTQTQTGASYLLLADFAPGQTGTPAWLVSTVLGATSQFILALEEDSPSGPGFLLTNLPGPVTPANAPPFWGFEFMGDDSSNPAGQEPILIDYYGGQNGAGFEGQQTEAAETGTMLLCLTALAGGYYLKRRGVM